MSEGKLSCPKCKSERIVKNGFIHNGNQNHKCRNCNRQFVLNPRNRPVTEESKKLIDSLLLERLSIAAICRVSGISQTWIQTYSEGKYNTVPQQVSVSSKKKGHLTIQCDEMWSFVGKKSSKQWTWLAMDVETREIVGLYVGSRSRKSAKRL